MDQGTGVRARAFFISHLPKAATDPAFQLLLADRLYND